MLLDPRFPAMRFLGVEPDIPIFAEQLIEAGRLEPLAIARAQHGPGRQAPYAPPREQSLSAIAVVTVIPDPAIDRQHIERTDAERAIGQRDIRLAAPDVGYGGVGPSARREAGATGRDKRVNRKG